MQERVATLVGRRSRAMWVMTFHSACARILRSDAERLGYKRGFTIYDEADSRRMVKRCMDELEIDPKRYPPRVDQGRRSPSAKNRLIDAETLQRGDGRLLRGDRRRRLRALREADARGQRDGLRRPARAHRQRARALRGRPRALRSAPSATSWSTSTRTPTAPSTGCCSCSPESTATSSSSATTTSRSTASAPPTSATSSTSRRTSRTRRSSSSSRTTARPRRSSTPPTR